MRASHLLPLIALLHQIPLPHAPNDFVEICAGDAAASSALRSSGFRGKEFDVVYSANHNLLRTVGFIAILAAVRNMRPGSFTVGGCTTLCNMGVAVTKPDRKIVDKPSWKWEEGRHPPEYLSPPPTLHSLLCLEAWCALDL